VKGGGHGSESRLFDDWRNIPITPIDLDFGEQTAQAGENACYQQPTGMVDFEAGLA